MLRDKHSFADSHFGFFSMLGELQRQKEFEVAMFMYRTGEQQNAYNAMNSIKTHGQLTSYNGFSVIISIYRCKAFSHQTVGVGASLVSGFDWISVITILVMQKLQPSSKLKRTVVFSKILSFSLLSAKLSFSLPGSMLFLTAHRTELEMCTHCRLSTLQVAKSSQNEQVITIAMCRS